MAGDTADEKGGLMADEEELEPIEEYDGEDVYGVRHVCRGFEGGLRESVDANGDTNIVPIDGRVVYVVEAIVDKHTHERRKVGGGLDLVHVTKMATVAIVERSVVAEALDAQANRNASMRAERDAARAADRERRKAERKAAKAGAAPVSLFSAVPDEGDELTDEERETSERLAAAGVGR